MGIILAVTFIILLIMMMREVAPLLFRPKTKNHEEAERKKDDKANTIVRQSHPSIKVNGKLIMQEKWFRIWRLQDGAFIAIRSGKGEVVYGDVSVPKMTNTQLLDWAYKNLGPYWIDRLVEIEPELQPLTYREIS